MTTSPGPLGSPIELWWSGLSDADRQRVEEAAQGEPLPPDLVAGLGRFHIEAVEHTTADDGSYEYHLPTVVLDFVAERTHSD